ncbi:PH domain-containing protein [Streptomyces polyrhachis]|uniref:PH domain-containing protein n=1 Tax=Streptomyces polyrhachis TaxID=1282885 RepID=A0ABW2GEY4_9ACTN
MSSSSPTPSSESAGPAENGPQYADRVYRSVSGIAGGVLLIAASLALGVDGLVRGSAYTRVVVGFGLLWWLPLLFAYTVRPAVFASADRLRVRNPLRTLTVPWRTVAALRPALTNELYVDDRKYQLWAIPVSLRGRKRAARRELRGAGRAARGGDPGTEPMLHVDEKDVRSMGDRSMAELQELLTAAADRPGAQGAMTVRWAWELIAPIAVGAVALLVTVLVG